MEQPALYRNWLNFLKREKLYGAWMVDISTYMTYRNGNIVSSMCSKKTVYTVFNIDEVLNYFNTVEKAEFFLRHLTCVLYFNSIFKISHVNWERKFNRYICELKEKKKSPLSNKLVRHISRINNVKVKKGTNKVTKKVEQPWYNKGFERNNYSIKKAWRR